MKGICLCLGTVAACTAFAVPVQTEIVAIQPDSPVELTTGHCVAAPDRGSASMPEVSCDVSLTNLAQHNVVAYTVVWTPAHRGSAYSSRLALEPKPSLLFPRQTVTHRTYLAKSNDAVKVGVDFVLFDDGTYWGDDRTHVLKQIQDEITEQRATRETTRNKLLAAAQDEAARELVKRTLDAELADHTRDKYLTAKKIEGGNH